MTKISDTIIDGKSVKYIAKKYSPLDYNEKLTHLLSIAYPQINFTNWKKNELHQLVNDIVIKNYQGEEVLKYHLFNHFYKEDVVAAFEIKVNNSRADFLTINGCTNSFEIKSSLDNLYKLKKQSSDYILAFEYNHLVIDKRHLENAKELVPSCFGIWSFSADGKKQLFRDAQPNYKTDPQIQLYLLTNKERQQQFKDSKGNKDFILKEYNHIEINQGFKVALKHRYQKRWNFLLANHQSILPIDLQFFFNCNIEPGLIYQ